MTKLYLMRIKGKKITQGRWITKETAKRHAGYELWKDGQLRRVARNKKGHFITWKIIDVPDEYIEEDEIFIEEEPTEEYYTYRVDFDIRFKKES